MSSICVSAYLDVLMLVTVRTNLLFPSRRDQCYNTFFRTYFSLVIKSAKSLCAIAEVKCDIFALLLLSPIGGDAL